VDEKITHSFSPGNVSLLIVEEIEVYIAINIAFDNYICIIPSLLDGLSWISLQLRLVLTSYIPTSASRALSCHWIGIQEKPVSRFLFPSLHELFYF